MVLESIVSPFRAEKIPGRMFYIGFLYFSVAVFLSLWIFRDTPSLVMVFFTAMAAIPLMYNTLKIEEKKDETDLSEKILIKEHGKALSFFIFMFLGMTVAAAFWYVLLPAKTVASLFETQTNTLSMINPGSATGAVFFVDLGIFGHVLLNNLKVMIFCLLFSFVYGSGAIFILSWNASVIGTAIGNLIRTNIAALSGVFGFTSAAHYFNIVSYGLLRYALHGIPEILAYFTAGLAGGIISVAVIRHSLGTRKFEHIVFDSAELMIISIILLVIAAFLEVFVTPVLF